MITEMGCPAFCTDDVGGAWASLRWPLSKANRQSAVRYRMASPLKMRTFPLSHFACRFCRNSTTVVTRPLLRVLRSASGTSLRAKRDYAMLAVLFGCGLRRSELVGLDVEDTQVRQGHWAVVDLIGKGGDIGTVPVPDWAKAALDEWTTAAGIREGKIFRAVTRGKIWGEGISQNVVW